MVTDGVILPSKDTMAQLQNPPNLSLGQLGCKFDQVHKMGAPVSEKFEMNNAYFIHNYIFIL